MKQDPPNCIQIEMTEGCNLRCEFCGIRAITEKQGQDYKFMTMETAYSIARKIKHSGWNARIEFAMHGEPTMNPNWVNILALFRGQLPKHNIMLTTNGGGLLKKPGTDHWINRAMSQLNCLAIDAYEYAGIYKKIIQRYSGDIPWYPDNKSLSPHTRRKFKDRIIVFVRDISVSNTGTHSTLNNHSGCASPKNNKMNGKRCALPFRELSIRYNGSVAICCNDWRGYYKIGNALEYKTIDQLWQNEAYVTARKFLYNGLRVLDPCKGCDFRSYRVGLLPDKLGQLKLEQPDPTDYEVWRNNINQKPISKIIKRAWE